MSNYTPGPWTYCGYNRAVLEEKRSIDGCSETICEMPKITAQYAPDKCKANATLLASAPKLLEALKALAEEVKRHNAKQTELGNCIVVDLINALGAIDKAEGKGESGE